MVENGGKDSFQALGFCSVCLNFPTGHARSKEQATPGNQIRYRAPC